MAATRAPAHAEAASARMTVRLQSRMRHLHVVLCSGALNIHTHTLPPIYTEIHTEEYRDSQRHKHFNSVYPYTTYLQIYCCFVLLTQSKL